MLLISAAYICVQIFYKQIEYKKFNSEKEIPLIINQTVKNKNIPKSNSILQYKTIFTRNIFKASIDQKKVVFQEKSTKKHIEKLKRTSLDLTLLGTVIGTKNTYAVIEDNKNRLQALYQINDKLQEATIKRILKNKVILTLNSRDFLLEMDLNQVSTPFSGNPQEKGSLPSKKIILSKAKIQSSIKSIDDLKRQIRVRPLINNGESEGMLLYSIQPNSFFHTLGLQNGDVLKQVNGHAVTSFDDAFNIYQTMNDDASLKISLIRKGKEQLIMYQFKSDDTDSKGDSPS